MLQVPVFSMDGERTGELEIDPVVLGERVRPKLLKQAVVQYLANRRRGTAATRNRSRVAGSTRKLYRQKGTGNARAGAVRTCIRRGGGVAFAKGKQMRRLARNNAILAKITSGNAFIVDNLCFETPKTKRFAAMLGALGANRGCLVALAGDEKNAWKSGRNLPATDIRRVSDLHGYEILRRKKLIFSLPAFEVLRHDPVTLRMRDEGTTSE